MTVAPLRPLLALAAAAALSACAASAPPRTPPPAEIYAAAVVPSAPGARLWGDDTDESVLEAARARFRESLRRDWERAGRPPGGAPFDVLSLSGGGPDGAFAAGLLSGWSRSGERPEFDVVTGISVGALMAPFAFLGPDYDAALRMIFTEFDQDEVAVFSPFAALMGDLLGVADTSPLKRTIASLIDAPLLEAVAAAYRDGRTLLIGTTNIDAGRPVTWNMGAIAEAGEIELFRAVMLASASIPGVFPPVVIPVEAGGARYAEFHVDGGVTHSVITWPSGFNAVLREDAVPIDVTFYVIQNNTLTPAYQPVEAWLPAIATRSLSTLIRGQSAGDLTSIYLSAQELGAAFRLIFVPPEFSAASTAEFDSVYMTRLFETAEADALDGIDWLDRPPSLAGRRAMEAVAARP